ncbi:hypothetical protein Tco_0213214 [Tanacetum coccineum]
MLEDSRSSHGINTAVRQIKPLLDQLLESKLVHTEKKGASVSRLKSLFGPTVDQLEAWIWCGSDVVCLGKWFSMHHQAALAILDDALINLFKGSKSRVRKNPRFDRWNRAVIIRLLVEVNDVSAFSDRFFGCALGHQPKLLTMDL